MRRRLLETPGPANKLLLLEGADDFHFMGHFLEANGLDGACRLRAEEGMENIKKVLPLELKPGGPDVIGVVLDADFDARSTYESLYYLLVKSGYNALPRTLPVDGIIVAAGNMPRIGVWVMPDNGLPGMLEDFVKLLIPADDLLWDRALSAVAGIPIEERRFVMIQKAEIHTWLAWQEEPGTPLGQAVKKRYLDPGSPGAAVFLDWFRRLYLDSADGDRVSLRL